MPRKKVEPKTPKAPKRQECCEDDLSRELFFVWRSIMAKLSDVQTSLDAQTAAIQELTAALAAVPPAAATEADLDGVKSTIDTNTASITALKPA
jgi:hypothetical protein